MDGNGEAYELEVLYLGIKLAKSGCDVSGVAIVKKALDRGHKWVRAAAVQMKRVHRTPTSDLWLAEFRDPAGNHLALMSEVPVAAPSV